MAKTERAQYKFIIKEQGDGTPWLVLEPMNRSIASLNNGLLGFSLPEGTNHEQAKKITKYLNQNLGELSFTVSD